MALAPVAIFAHNEERNIEAAVLSVLRSFQGQSRYEPLVHVLENGSTDRTAQVVRGLAGKHPCVRLESIQLGDKSNAWNEYVHRIAPEAEGHIFMDGDVTLMGDAGPEILRVLEDHPEAMSAVGMPTGSPGAARTRRVLTEHPATYGQFYALKGASIRLFRERGVRLPIGHIGEDGLVGILVAKDLDTRATQNPRRCVAATRAFMHYEAIRWYSPRDLRKYWRRRITYAERYFQFQFLGPRLKRGGVEAMPRHIVELYGQMDGFRRPFRFEPNLWGFDVFFDVLAWRRMKRKRAEFARRQD